MKKRLFGTSSPECEIMGTAGGDELDPAMVKTGQEGGTERKGEHAVSAMSA